MQVLVLGAGTRFRPLSFNLAKPLFPLAGRPMVHHPILACKKVSVGSKTENFAHFFWHNSIVSYDGTEIMRMNGMNLSKYTF